MADYDAISDALRSHFATSWDALSNGYPTATHLCPENDIDWSEPKDVNGRPLPWFRANVEVVNSDQETFGNKYGWMGHFIVEFFAPINTGTGALEDLVSDAMPILRRQQVSSIDIFNPYPAKVGNVEDEYYKINVVAEWRHLEAT